MPNLVASNALRLPAFKIEDVDACQLAVSMKTLSDQVNYLKNAFNDVNAKVNSLPTAVQDQRLLLSATSKASQPLPPSVLATTAAASNTGLPSWASLVSQSVPAGAYQLVRRKVVGSGSATSKLASAYKKDQLWHIFIVVSIKIQLNHLLPSVSR